MSTTTKGHTMIDSRRQQRMDALAKANAIRGNGAEIKRRLRAREVTFAEAINHPDAGHIPLHYLLASVFGFGPRKVSSVVLMSRIRRDKLVRDLTNRERDLLIALVGHCRNDHDGRATRTA